MAIKKLKINANKAKEEDKLKINIPDNLELEESYVVEGVTRDVSNIVDIAINNNDKVLEFVFTDKTTWISDAATLHEIFPEAHGLSRSTDDSFLIPDMVTGADGDRGFFGSIALKVLNVFKKKAIPIGIGNIVNRLEDKLMADGEGLMQLDKDFTLKAYNDKKSNKPYLLFIHGTNSNTVGAFCALSTSETWDYIKSTYDENILGFEHRTLSKSPLQNVVDLINQLPIAAELHIISHSRGGIVGDIICKYARNSNDTFVGFTAEHINLLKKEGNRQNDIDAIKVLNKAFAEKKIKVNKFIRVGCPAAGTKLASKRLDTILNTFFNLFGGALNPLADTLKELIVEALRTKDDVSVLPGLEAQSPDSPFIKILNDRSDEAAIDGKSLAVISGNGKLSLSFKGLLYILGKLFYSQRNDLVVNTDSMYLGAKRKDLIQYFFDQGADVDHVKYFTNTRTRQAISLALKTIDGELIPGFTAVKQYEVPASDRALFGIEYGELLPTEYPTSNTKPILILLPGIMGSNLQKQNKKLWLAYMSTLMGGLINLEYADNNSVTAASLIKTSYKQLADRLSKTYEIIIYPFDWRRQLNDCAKDFNERILQLLNKNRPIKIVGHSMGGVLVRDFIINYPETWNKLNHSRDFKLLFLGAPLGGSFRIPAVLFGNDAIINSLNMLDIKHTKKELVTMFCTFPGILSLLPLNKEPENDFADPNVWKKMAEAFGDNSWPLPDKMELEKFRAYRDNILLKRDAIDYSNMVYIAGKDKATPCGYFNDDIPPRKELVFLCTTEGDQSVTWAMGIPKQMIDNGSVYYADNVSHGALANAPEIFNAIEQILDKGNTNLLSKNKPADRSPQQTFRMPQVFEFDFSEAGMHNALFGITEKNERPISRMPLNVSVSNGDLAYASYPVLAGHFLNDGILYAEAAINKNVNNSLHDRHYLGLYPGEIGSNTIVIADKEEQDFKGAMIIGLGEPGTLTSYLLTKTVEQGICKYLLNINSKPDDKREIGISSIMIGCGYGGLAIENAVKAIIEGVNNANAKVIECRNEDVRTVQNIEFIELYEDKALTCLYALSKIESKENRIYNISLVNKKIKKLFGVKTRLPVNSSDEWWNRFTVKMKRNIVLDEVTKSLVFSASTSDAREEEQELFSSISLVDPFIKKISLDNQWNASMAKTLFEIMIPNEFKGNLKKKGNICWVLDKETAAYPWELLKENITEAKPLCIGAGMIRQLTTKEYRQKVTRVAIDRALIVGDPQLDGYVSQLPGAAAEASKVASMFSASGYSNDQIIGGTASDIILKLFSQDFKVIHLAGHGMYNPKVLHKSGMVIGKEMFLTVADFKQMGAVPELVFVNCCHLGNIDSDGEIFYRERYKLAANIGTQLIEIGVKVVIAAGWAVNDIAASDFADEFYRKLLDGNNFGDAVKAARKKIYEDHPNNNTWGAYQCYGDPFYKLINRTETKEELPFYIIEEEVEIDLINLRNDLDTRNISPTKAIERLKLISTAMDIAKISNGFILEQQALILYELGEYKAAIDKFEELKKEESANFSVSALENYCNARSKQCVVEYKIDTAKTGCEDILTTIIGELTELLKINRTAKRISLIAGAYKRKGMVAAKQKDKLDAYKAAADHYLNANSIKESPYTYTKWLALQAGVHLANNIDYKAMKFGEVGLSKIVKDITAKKMKLTSLYNNMDYFQLNENISYDFTLLLLDSQQKDDKMWKDLAKGYKHIWRSTGSKGKQIAEVENFDIFIDILSTNKKNKRCLYLVDKITELKKELEKLIDAQK